MSLNAASTKEYLVTLFRRGAIISSLVVLVCALLCVVGWYFDLPRLKSPFSLTIPFGVAISYTVLSISILLNAVYPAARILKYARIASAVALAGFSGLKSAEILSGQDWEFLNLPLSPELSTGLVLSFPGQMTPDASLAIMLLSLSLLLIELDSESFPALWKWLLNFVGAVSFLPVIGFIQGIPQFCGLWGCVKVPATLAMATLMLTFALFSLRPQRSWFALLIEPDLLGTALRRSVFALMIMLPAFTLLKALVVNSGLLVESTATPTISLLTILIGIAVVISQVAFAYKQERQLREATEKRVQVLSNELSMSRPDGISRSSGIAGVPRVNRCPTCSQEFDLGVTTCPDDGATLATIDFLIGQNIEGKYKVVEFLGTGGMSIVYKVKHLVLGKDLAFKLLRNHLLGNSRFVQRFQREGKAIARLSHPNLITVHECGLWEGVPYLLLDYVQGETLEQLVDQFTRMPTLRTIEIVIEACEGLAHAHSNDIIHRDLKPGNIMLTRNYKGEQTVKVLDFGLAKMIEAEEGFLKLSQTGEALGSPLYMSPEQVSGTGVDARTDVYALGCVLYECIAGKTPFMGSTIMDTFDKILREQPPPLSETLSVPYELDSLVLRCLSKSPEQRPASVIELREELERIYHLIGSQPAQV